MDNNNTMEYRIGLEKQNKRNDQVTELILDNCRASQISGLTEEFVNLETLSLINVGLTTLKGFPKLPKLKKLEISDNRLTGGLNLLHGSPNLQSLNISGNRIKDLDALEPLKEFHDLVSLDLYNCDVTKVEEYRKKVFDLLPNLKALDGYDRDEREVDSEDDDEEGSDVENHIVMGDNELDEEEAVDDDEDDDEDVDDDDDDDEDDDDDDDDEEDDEDDDDDDEEVDDEHDDEEDEGGVDYENEVDIHDDIENEDNDESLEQESLEERFGEVQGDHYHPPKKVRLDPCPELGDEDVNNFDEDKLENDDEEKLGSEVEDKPENEEEDKDNALGDAPSI